MEEAAGASDEEEDLVGGAAASAVGGGRAAAVPLNLGYQMRALAVHTVRPGEGREGGREEGRL